MIDQQDPKFVLAYADWLGVSPADAYMLLEQEPAIELDEDGEPIQAAGWEEEEHPRYPEGHPQGGQFRPKGGEEESAGADDFHRLGSERDPEWVGPQLTPTPTDFIGIPLDAIEKSDIVWRGQKDPSRAGYQVYDDYYDPELHQSEQYKREVAEEFKRIAAEGELRISTPAGAKLLAIVEDGRFKNQFETMESGGAFAPHIRSIQEKMFFGYPQRTPGSERPIYGWLDHPDQREFWDIDRQIAQYGEVTWHIKPEVRSRTTVTAVDTLSRPVVPGPIRNPGWRAAVPPGFTDEGTHTIISDHLTGTGFFDDVIETQYHGGVTLNEVESVDISEEHLYYDPEYYERTMEAVQKLHERGIRVRFVDTEGGRSWFYGS